MTRLLDPLLSLLEVRSPLIPEGSTAAAHRPLRGWVKCGRQNFVVCSTCNDDKGFLLLYMLDGRNYNLWTQIAIKPLHMFFTQVERPGGSSLHSNDGALLGRKLVKEITRITSFNLTGGLKEIFCYNDSSGRFDVDVTSRCTEGKSRLG